jgi:hypothetical protein
MAFLPGSLLQQVKHRSLRNGFLSVRLRADEDSGRSGSKGGYLALQRSLSVNPCLSEMMLGFVSFDPVNEHV